MVESDDDRAERHGRILKALAECNLRAVIKLTGRLEAAETGIEHERLALGSVTVIPAKPGLVQAPPAL